VYNKEDRNNQSPVLDYTIDIAELPARYRGGVIPRMRSSFRDKEILTFLSWDSLKRFSIHIFFIDQFHLGH
jgi:hypothetical protein